MRFLVAIVAAILAADLAPPAPDIAKGEIEGKAALYLMPLAGVEDGPGSGAKFERILSPDGCEAHLALTKELDRELVYRCSSWIMPPEGNSRPCRQSPFRSMHRGRSQT